MVQGTTDTLETTPAFQRQVNLLEHIFQLPLLGTRMGKNAKILQCAGSKGRETDLKQGSNLDICKINVFLLLNMCIYMYAYICIHIYVLV